MKKLFGNFFEDKTILITGHTGFMGSWMSIWLNELGANLIGYALPPYTKKDNFVVTNLEKKIKNIIGDIRDYKNLNDVFKKYDPDIVFHLAAQPIVRKSYNIPKETYDVNVGGTVNIFEAFRNHKSSRILINVTTDKVYENREWIWGYRENDRLGGYDPYSSSKSCSDLITSAYYQSYFNSNNSNLKKIVSSVRSGNVIGGGDWQEDRLIPDCMKAIEANEEICIRNPQSVRPWQHILDPIRGYLMLAMRMWEGNKLFSGAWNFGPDNNSIYCVKDIVEKIIKYLRKGNYRCLSLQECDDLHETEVLMLDNSKSFRYLGWKPGIYMDDTIKLLCDWYKEENVDYEFDVKQIETYSNLIKQ
ncbi:MAG: CDP-glucose 4,6-dehydratase [Promethearchaeota archaeon]